MLVILFSIPFDLLIGDGDVACTTVCPSIFSVPTPGICACWNLSPGYVGNGALELYVESSGGPLDPNCIVTIIYYYFILKKINKNPSTGQHVGNAFGNNNSCCYTPIPSTYTSPLPVCQSPDDVFTNATGYPGSCVSLTACRPDSLPSCANDPMTPPGDNIPPPPNFLM